MVGIKKTAVILWRSQCLKVSLWVFVASHPFVSLSESTFLFPVWPPHYRTIHGSRPSSTSPLESNSILSAFRVLGQLVDSSRVYPEKKEKVDLRRNGKSYRRTGRERPRCSSDSKLVSTGNGPSSSAFIGWLWRARRAFSVPTSLFSSGLSVSQSGACGGNWHLHSARIAANIPDHRQTGWKHRSSLSHSAAGSCNFVFSKAHHLKKVLYIMLIRKRKP